MIKLIQFHFKRIILSPFYVMSYIIVLACFLVFGMMLSVSSITFINYIAQFECYIYFEVVLVALVFCMAVYFTRQSSALEPMCLYSRAQICLSKMIATSLCSLLLCLIPIFYVVINAIQEQTGFTFNLYALVYVVFRWAILILSSQYLSFICTYFIRNPATYVLSLPAAIIFSYLNQTIFSFLFGNNSSKISTFFSMQKPYVHALDLDYSGARVDLFLLSKLVYVLIGVALVIVLIWLFSASKKNVPAIMLAVLIILESGSIYVWLTLNPKVYTYQDKLFVTDYTQQSCSVLSYTGDIKLSEFSEIYCEVELLPSTQQTVKFRLDECFNIKELKCDDVDLLYDRGGDYVTIDLLNIEATPITLSFRYTGRIYYLSDIYSVNIFSTHNSTALPARFAFLPIIDGDNTNKCYNLNVNSGNTLISNLNVNKTGNNAYLVTGESISCCLFSGYFSEYERNGITFYRSKYNQVTNYEEVYNNSLNYRHFDAFTATLTDESYTTPQKVFLIYSLYGVLGFPIVFDNYVLLNYGYTSA